MYLIIYKTKPSAEFNLEDILNYEYNLTQSEIDGTYSNQIEHYTNILENEEEIKKVLLELLKEYAIDNSDVWIDKPGLFKLDHAIIVLNIKENYINNIVELLKKFDVHYFKSKIREDLQDHTRKFINLTDK